MAATERFLRLPAEKQAAIIEAGKREFSDHGFEYATTNAIAARAGVSVGALYQYFPTKQDLFLYIVQQVAVNVRTRIEAIVTSPGSVLERVAGLLTVVRETSEAQRADVELYHELTAAGNRSFARQVALELEGYSAGAYTALIAEGQRSGELRTDIPAPVLAFLIDNVFISLQYAYACDYFADRCELYLGHPLSPQDDALIEQVLAFLTAATEVRS